MKRLLILSQTFFPDKVVGAIRISQWAKYLPDFGWEAAVICWHYGPTATPELLAKHLHPSIQVRYLTDRAPGAHSSSLVKNVVRKSRAQMSGALLPFTVPDPYVLKWRAYMPKVERIADEFRPDAILSSSPPVSIHEVGFRLASRLQAPWVADFRDPYLIDSRYQPRGLSTIRIRAHRQCERAIYENAQLVVHAIPLHGRWGARRYPFARVRIRVLTNGIPTELLDEEFLQSAGHHKVIDSARVSIRAVGALGRGAVQTIAETLRQLLDHGVDAEFRHVGHARDVSDAIPADLRDRVQLRGPVSHQEALREIAGADVLLKYDDLERAQVNGLSSKLFEYLATGRPIVAVNPTRPDWQLIGRLPWCWCLTDPQPAALAEALQQAISSGTKPPEEWLATFRQQYNRRNQTQQLAGWLDELAAKKS